MPKRPASCTGKVLIDKRTGHNQKPFELVTIHFPDGTAVCTIADVAAKLGIALADGDQVTLTLAKGRKRS
jgi:hypothetical protein